MDIIISFQKMYGFGGVDLSEVMLSISELSVLGGWVDYGTNALHGRTWLGSDKKEMVLNSLYASS